MVISCRFYEQKYPEVDDVVMVNVRSIADMGAYVHLLEYNNIEGMILLSELSRRRIRSINKLIRVGRTEPVVVIRVDKDKGYIDLSKRRVSKEDIERCTEKYSKAKAVNSIVRHVAEILGYKSNEELEDLYKKNRLAFRAEEQKTGIGVRLLQAGSRGAGVARRSGSGRQHEGSSDREHSEKVDPAGCEDQGRL